VIRILPEDQHLGVGVGRVMQCGKDVALRRIHGVIAAFLGYERLQRRPIRLVELGA